MVYRKRLNKLFSSHVGVEFTINMQRDAGRTLPPMVRSTDSQHRCMLELNLVQSVVLPTKIDAIERSTSEKLKIVVASNFYRLTDTGGTHDWGRGAQLGGERLDFNVEKREKRHGWR